MIGKASKAEFLRKDVKTPVVARFSTVAGSKGSCDLARGVPPDRKPPAGLPRRFVFQVKEAFQEKLSGVFTV